MSDWAVGLSTGCFYQRNILECLGPIRESGFSLLEICSSPAHLDYHDTAAVRLAAARLADLGLTAHSFHAPFADRIDISALNAGRRSAALREILLAVEAAASLRTSYFVVHPGPEHAETPPDGERYQRMENVVTTLNAVARHCRDAGIRCLLENKLPHLLFGKTSDILWILDALEDIEVGACLDTGHAHLAGDIHHLVHKLSGYLRLIHAHDNRGHGDDHLPPGDGRIDWPALLRQFDSIRYPGAIILELAGKPDMAFTLADARRGRTFLRELLRQLGSPRQGTVAPS